MSVVLLWTNPVGPTGWYPHGTSAGCSTPFALGDRFVMPDGLEFTCDFIGSNSGGRPWVNIGVGDEPGPGGPTDTSDRHLESMRVPKTRN